MGFPVFSQVTGNLGPETSSLETPSSSGESVSRPVKREPPITPLVAASLLEEPGLELAVVRGKGGKTQAYDHSPQRTQLPIIWACTRPAPSPTAHHNHNRTIAPRSLQLLTIGFKWLERAARWRSRRSLSATEVAVSRLMFRDILMLIARLRAPPAPA
jgi:hypothetical protein